MEEDRKVIGMGGNGANSKKRSGGGGASNTRAEIDGKLRDTDNINQGIREITPILNKAPVGTRLEFSAYGGAKNIYQKESPRKWKYTFHNAGKNQWSQSQSTKVAAASIFNSAKGY